MCGICGIWLREGGVRSQTLIAMRDSIAHRGPDDASGVLISSSGAAPAAAFTAAQPPAGSPDGHDVGLGHRRLSIIDVAHGHQPFADEDRRVWLVYNGELYNYRELRHELAGAGASFRTRSDTEVVLRAYQRHGVDCVARMNGIFAFAIWDESRRRLFLARDHFGVKPLYYADTPSGFIFGSEIKALLASELLSAEIDHDALGVALTFRYTPSPQTLFRGIGKLAPGECMLVRDGRVARRWFTESDDGLPAADPARGAPWASRLSQGITDAVGRQMVSDVPIGLSLSSGVDSSTLLTAMQRSGSEPVHTFTIGFEGAGRDDELPRARALSQAHGARCESRRVGAEDYRRFMARYMWHLEEPIGNESAPAYYFVAEMARAAQTKVLLTGQGPDELFAGYDRHVGVAFSRLLRLTAQPWAQALVQHALRGRAMAEKHRRLVSSMASDELGHRLLAAYTVFTADDLATILRPEVRAEIDWSHAGRHVEGWLARARGRTPLEKMLWIDTRTLLSDNLLLAGDKMAMAASVEARVPFLDREFVRLAEQVPGALKLRLGRRKHVHRQACAQLIGRAGSRRRKIGFANPMAQWLRSSDDEPILAALDEPGSFLNTFVNGDAVRAMLSEHRSQQRDHTRKLYFLASLEAWHATFVG